MSIVKLRCEYRPNPLGIETARPRLSWQMKTARRGARQTAYRLCVSSRRNGPADLWDSGKVLSDQSVHVVYAGQALAPGQRVWWRVAVWDEAGKKTESTEAAWWELGLPGVAWEAQWIGAPLAGGKKVTPPAPYLRTEFTVPNKKLSRARLYATALGVYEAYLNGGRVGDEVFAPGFTDYRQRVMYQTYDVTSTVRPGRNCLGAILGEGWCCGYFAFDGVRQAYADQPWLLTRLVLEFADGSRQVVVSDANWQTAFGPILANDFQMGESYDARREMPGWAKPGFAAGNWSAVKVNLEARPALTARLNPPVRRIVELKPISQRQAGKSWIFDLGQNMVGVVRLKAKGAAGQTVVLRHAEMLKPDGTLYTENLRTAAATDSYTFHGKGVEVFEPRFTFHGFRYVEVAGLTGAPLPGAVTGIVLHSDTPATGEFRCSDPLVNQLQHNIQWGQRGNFLEVPTDCPNRDERAGWTGDAQVFFRTAAFNMNVATFFEKWLLDVRDSQGAKGLIGMWIPTGRPYKDATDGGPAWADAMTIIPWTMYLCYGDRRVLAENYPAIVRFIDCIKGQSLDLIRCHPEKPCHAFGDWLAQDGSTTPFANTPNEVIGTAFLAHSVELAGKIARVLGKTADAKRFATLAGQVRAAFSKRYLTGDNLLYGNTQTAYVLALHFRLVPDHARDAIAAQLLRDIQKREMHLSTGFVGTPYLNHVLTDTGQLDTAYALLFQKTWPSWLYAVTQGATTIWERWDGWTHDKGFQDVGMNSFNHYAYGAIGDWLYARVAGLDLDPTQPGYKRIRFRPQPGGGLKYARAKLATMYGQVESGWRITKAGTEYTFVVPPNTTGRAELGPQRLELAPGRHKIVIKS